MAYKTLIDDYFRKVPEYYPEMYQDGFTPEEIMYAFRKQLKPCRQDKAQGLFSRLLPRRENRRK